MVSKYLSPLMGGLLALGGIALGDPALGQEPAPSTPAAAETAAAGVGTLAIGDRGDGVASLQRLLITLGYDQLEADGIYGSGTADVVIRFQEEQGIPPTGTPTWATWGHLWASPWQDLDPSDFPRAGMMATAEGRVESPPPVSPLWLIMMPMVPLLGGALAYWRRRGRTSLGAGTPSAVTGRGGAILHYFPLLGLAIVSGVAFGSYVWVRSRLIPPVQGQLERLADEQVQILDRWFDQQRQALLDAATNPDEFPEIFQLLSPADAATGASEDAAEEGNGVTYEAFVDSFSRLTGFDRDTLSVLNNGGIVVFAADPARQGQYQPIQNTTTYFTQEQSNQVPNLYVSSLTDTLQITFATPVINEEGIRIGVLAVDLDLGDLHQQVQQGAMTSTVAIARRPSQSSYLVGQASAVQNQIIAADTMGTALTPDGVDSQGIDAALAGQNGADLYLNYDRVPVIGAYRWASRHNLALLVEVNQAEIFHPARQIARQIFVIGLIVTALLSLALRRFVPDVVASAKPSPALGEPQQSSSE